MGIKELNQYLLTKCSKNAIHKIQFNDLIHKTVVIDISIYLYKFMTDGNFMEHLYTFLSLFKYYIITPIFIFDGKPPPEKWELLRKRRWEKKDAEVRLLEIQDSIRSDSTILNSVLEKEIEELNRKVVKLTHGDIMKSKELIHAFGFIYYEAPGEADILCAYLVNRGTAWACLSDDMDLFLYGCPRVLRNLSLLNHSIMSYDTNQILSELKLTYTDFLEIAVLCGTDYNKGYGSLRKTFELHNEYKNMEMVIYEPESQETSKEIAKETFYHWFIKHSKINETDNFTTICSMFDISGQLGLDSFSQSFNIDVLEKKANVDKIKEIMIVYGFLFP